MRVKQSVVWLRTAIHALGTSAGGVMAMSLMTMAPVQTVQAQSLPACAAAWSASAVYTGGSTASENGTNYVANWWTQGNDPATNNGGSGSGQPWTSQGACSSSSSGGGSSGGGGSGGGTTPPPAPAPGTGANLVFSPYKDVTVNLNWNTNVMQTAAATGSAIPVVGTGSLKSSYVTDLSAITLAFATGECGSENWGGVPGATFASANVSALSSAGLPYIVSTGGQAGTFTCGTTAGFAQFLSRYMSSQMIGVDFDIEGGQSQAQINALVAAAVYGQSLYPNLRFSFTLATLGASDGSYGGLNSLGNEVMTAIKASTLTNYTINLMTMDYGGPSSSVCVVSGSVCDMGQSAIQAALNLEHTYGTPASKIELTPMIGVNDVSSENFSVANADTVVSYAVANGLAGVHFWSLDRDTPCSQSTASPTCNSVSTSTPLQYTKRILSDLGR